MKTSSGERNPVELLAEDFLDRKRRGERPTLQEYLDRHPELAEEIRDLFPALLMVEDLGESSGGTTGSLAAENGLAAGARLERLGESDADKLSGPMAKRNTGKMEPETK